MRALMITLSRLIFAFGLVAGGLQAPIAGWIPHLAAQTGGAGLPRTKSDAEKWLRARGLGFGPEALGFYLTLSNGLSADVVRVMLVSGASATKPTVTGDYPLSVLAISCHGQAAAAEIGEILLQNGASVDVVEPEGRKATPAMAAVMCPALLKVILAKKPNLNAVDANGLTAMDYAIRFGKPRYDVMRLMKDNGFDIARWRAHFREEYTDTVNGLLDTLSGPAATAAPRASAASPGARPAAGATTSSPTPVAIDWKAVGPYPSRTASEATRLLAQPGADTTADDHFWDGITRREPQRLALALQAGASVRLKRAGSGYTPLMVLADRCDVDRDADAQVAIADQLIAAGADAAAVHPDGSTALMIAADDCPIGVIRALVKAGSPLSAQKDGNTALKLAILEGRADVVDVLLDAGLDLKKEPYNVNRTASGNKAVEAALKKKRK